MKLEINFAEFPILETSRLILREVQRKDVNEVFHLRSDKEIMKYIPRPLAITIEDAYERIQIFNDFKEKGEAINWAVTLKGDDTLIGIFGILNISKENFRGEVGYMLHPNFQRKGITSEALEKIIEFGFGAIGLHSLDAIIDPENIGSEKVLQKANFKKEAHFVENYFYEGKFLDSVHYCLINKN